MQIRQEYVIEISRHLTTHGKRKIYDLKAQPCEDPGSVIEIYNEVRYLQSGDKVEDLAHAS